MTRVVLRKEKDLLQITTWSDAPRQRLHGGQQFALRHRFEQTQVSAAAVAVHGVCGLDSARYHDDADSRLRVAYPCGQADAVFAGQVDVDQVDVGKPAASLDVQRFRAGQSGGMVPGLVEDRHRDLTQGVVVFHNDELE